MPVWPRQIVVVFCYHSIPDPPPFGIAEIQYPDNHVRHFRLRAGKLWNVVVGPASVTQRLKHFQAEWQYRRDERLGILCGDQTPTPEQIRLAEKEANEICEKLKYVTH